MQLTLSELTSSVMRLCGTVEYIQVVLLDTKRSIRCPEQMALLSTSVLNREQSGNESQQEGKYAAS